MALIATVSVILILMLIFGFILYNYFISPESTTLNEVDPLVTLTESVDDMANVEKVLSIVYKSIATNTRSSVIKLERDVSILMHFRNSLSILVVIMGIVLGAASVYLGVFGSPIGG